MLSAVEVFDLVKHKQKIESDYALAQRLQITNGLIAKHRKRQFGMSNDLARKCAPLAGIPEELLVLWASAQRAKCTEEQAIFERVATWLELSRPELLQGFGPALLAESYANSISP